MTYRLVAAVCLALVGAVVSAQSPPPQAPSGTGLIVGQVVDQTTGRAVPDVAVTLVQPGYVRPGGNLTNSRPVLSDAQGRFVLRGIPAGTYKITARRLGYVESLYGALTPDGDGKAITLAEGGRFGDATVRLWKLGAIGGRVVDDAGDPIIGLQVRAFKRNLIAGRWKFGEYYSGQKYGARTDDRGTYRISDVEPGEYIVTVPVTTAVAPASAVAELEALRTDPAAREAYAAASESFSRPLYATRLPVNGAGTPMAIGVGDAIQTLLAPGLAPVSAGGGPWLMYQTQFYPGTNLSTSAQPIAITAGQEVDRIDFGMKPVRSWRVAGTVSGLPAGTALPMRLVHADSEAVLDETEVAATISGADGSFVFLGVPAGNYVIKVLRVPVLPPQTTQVGSGVRSEQAQGVSMEATLWAAKPVSVGAGDVSGLVVALGTGVRATGRVVFDGARPKPTAAQLASMEVTIAAAGGEPPLIFRSDRVRLAGETFLTPELAPGKYVIRSNAPAGWTMKSVTAGTQDVVDTPLVVDGRDIPPITVTLTDRALGSIGGAARHATGSSDTLVCLFPAERSAWVDYGGSSRRLQRVQPDQAGAYRISGVPAGNYFVAAVADDRSADWRDPRHLDALSKIATRVTLADEEPRTLDVSARRVSATKLTAGAHQALTDHVVAGFSEPGESQRAGPFVAETELVQQAPPRATPRPAPEPTGGGSIAGVITSAGTNPVPVRRVIVLLNSTDPKVGRTTVTDEEGRFAFAALPAARYSLTATKPGYLDTRYGATRPEGPGTPIVLADNEKAVVAMKLIKGAVITGTVRDAYGEPVRGVTVSVSQLQMNNGERRLSSVGRSEATDDRGQYRVFGLAPGEYFVNTERATVGFYPSLSQTTAEDLAAAQRELRASGSAPAPATTPTVLPAKGYAPVFHPGTTLYSQAAAVPVSAGEEKAGVDIEIRLVPFARLSARVLGPDGQPPAMTQGRLIPQMSLPGLSLVGLDSGMLFNVVTDGTIRINSIPPGEYTLHAGGSTIAPPPMAATSGGGSAPQGALGLPMWASMPVTIDGRDIDGLTIQLQLGKVMTGRIAFEGTTAPPPSVSFSLVGPQMGGTMMSRRGTANPEFRIDGIVPAAYRVSAAGLRGWTVKSAVINGRDAADLPVDINTDVSDAVITLTDKLTELSGVLQTPAGAPATNYFVIVFARDPAYWYNGSRRIVSLRPGTNGRFITTATSPLPPGDYLIAAVTDVRSGEWFDPEFLKALTSSAVPSTLGEGEKKRQDLQIK